MPQSVPDFVELDASLAELAILDVVDVLPNGALCLNQAFLNECIGRLDTDPSSLDTVVQDCIVARAVERGYAGCVDVELLALAALELGTAEEESNPHV